MQRQRLVVSGILGFLSIIFTPSFQAQAISAPLCDPHAKVLTAVRAEYDGGKFDKALADVEPVLHVDPHDFRANYLKGMILFDQANAVDANHWFPPLPLSPQMAAGFDLLKSTAAELGSQDLTCARRKDFYAILNTLGAFYLNRGYFPEAEKYLREGYANKTNLSSTTYRKTLDNLGLVYLIQKNGPQSAFYYREAVAQGSSVAKVQLPKAEALAASQRGVATIK